MLRVIQAFGDHEVGDEITDATAIAAVLASDQACFVVAVTPPPAKPAKPDTSAS